MGMEIVLAFAKTNDTIHAEHILLSAGLSVRIMPLPPVIRAGCGLCIRLPESQQREAAELLETAEIAVDGTYIRKEAAGGGSTYSLYTGDNNG